MFAITAIHQMMDNYGYIISPLGAVPGPSAFAGTGIYAVLKYAFMFKPVLAELYNQRQFNVAVHGDANHGLHLQHFALNNQPEWEILNQLQALLVVHHNLWHSSATLAMPEVSHTPVGKCEGPQGYRQGSHTTVPATNLQPITCANGTKSVGHAYSAKFMQTLSDKIYST
ncbi:hypothetical protein C8Q74DRAFT_1220801 [Fomes fomentarius]|nr:hypothetical protein C8Q74DRAFT_1220801 [Fomes fomentarius]